MHVNKEVKRRTAVHRFASFVIEQSVELSISLLYFAGLPRKLGLRKQNGLLMKYRVGDWAAGGELSVSDDKISSLGIHHCAKQGLGQLF